MFLFFNSCQLLSNQCVSLGKVFKWNRFKGPNDRKSKFFFSVNGSQALLELYSNSYSNSKWDMMTKVSMPWCKGRILEILLIPS